MLTEVSSVKGPSGSSSQNLRRRGMTLIPVRVRCAIGPPISEEMISSAISIPSPNPGTSTSEPKIAASSEMSTKLMGQHILKRLFAKSGDSRLKRAIVDLGFGVFISAHHFQITHAGIPLRRIEMVAATTRLVVLVKVETSILGTAVKTEQYNALSAGLEREVDGVGAGIAAAEHASLAGERSPRLLIEPD